MDAEKFPVDVTLLEKGQTYNLGELGLLQTQTGSTDRKLELLVMRDTVQKLAEASGLVMSIRVEKDDSLYVMTDAEAMRYHDNAARISVHRLGRQVNALRTRVDRSNLSDEEKEEHIRTVARRGLQYMAAITSERKQKAILGNKSKRMENLTSLRPNPFKQD